MRLSELYAVIVRHFTNRNNFINILFYLLAGGVIWYLYNFKALITLILLLLSTAALSSFVISVYFWIKGRFKVLDKELIYSLLFVIIMLPLALFILDKQMLGYILALSAVIIGIGIYRS